MNKKNGKRILITAISASILLVVALVIWLIAALILKWDIYSWWTTTQAYLVYFLVGLAVVYLAFAIIMYLTIWRYK